MKGAIDQLAIAISECSMWSFVDEGAWSCLENGIVNLRFKVEEEREAKKGMEEAG